MAKEYERENDIQVEDNNQETNQPQRAARSNSEQQELLKSKMKTTEVIMFLGPPENKSKNLLGINTLQSLGLAYGELKSECFFLEDDYMPNDRENSHYEAYHELENDAREAADFFYNTEAKSEAAPFSEIQGFRTSCSRSCSASMSKVRENS